MPLSRRSARGRGAPRGNPAGDPPGIVMTAEAIGLRAMPWPVRTAQRLAGLGGWRRALAAGLAGALAAFALPPADVLPVLLVAFPALLWLLDGVRSRRGAF